MASISKVGAPDIHTVGAIGETGATGPQGPAGADGATPVKGVDYFTEEDKAEIVQEGA